MARIPYPEKDTAPDDQRKALEHLEQNSRRVLNMNRLMSYHPKALETFSPFYAAVVSGTLDPKLRELAYIRTAMVNRCEYCEQAHRTLGRRAGLTDQQLADLVGYESSVAYTPAEKSVLRYAEELTRTAQVNDGTFAEVAAHLTSAHIVELNLVVAIANFTNRFNMGLGIDVDTRPLPKA